MLRLPQNWSELSDHFMDNLQVIRGEAGPASVLPPSRLLVREAHIGSNTEQSFLLEASTSALGPEPDGEDQQTDIGRDAERGQYGNDITARPELLAMQSILAHFREKLLVPCTLLVFAMCSRLQVWCVQPSWRRNRLVNKMPAPYTAKSAPIE
jgi:hypothetical protein